MGTLLGHALPGSFFILFSLWRLLQTIRRLQMIRAAYRWDLLSSGASRPSHRHNQNGGGCVTKSSSNGTPGKASERISSCHHDKQLRNFETSEISLRSDDDQHCNVGLPISCDFDDAKITENCLSADANLTERDPKASRKRQQYLSHNTTNSDRTCDVRHDDNIKNDYYSPWTYFTSASYPCYFCCFTRVPLEAIVKILATSVGMAGEIAASTDWGKAGTIRWWGDIQHVTMYGFFFLSGIVDLLGWFRVGFVPRGLEFLTLAQAFAGEYLLFRNHNHGADDFERQLHSRLTLVIGLIVLTILLEYLYSRSLSASLSTTYLMFLQGTWFIQVGLILYPPSPNWFQAFTANSNLSPSDQLMLADMVFCWHVGGGFVLLVLMFLGVLRLLENFGAPSRWEVSDRALVKSCAAEVILASSTATLCDVRQHSMTPFDADYITTTSLMSSSDCYRDGDENHQSYNGNGGSAVEGLGKGSRKALKGVRRGRHDSMNNFLNDDEEDLNLWSDDNEESETLIYTSTA